MGSVSHDFRAAKALFSLLCRLKSTLRTCHAAGRLQTNAFCSSSGVWEVRCPKKKKGQLHLPQAGSSTRELPAMEAAQPHLKHRQLPGGFYRGRLRSLRFYCPSNYSFQCWGEAGRGHSSSVQGHPEGVWPCQGHKRCSPCPERPEGLPEVQFAGRCHGKAPSARPQHRLTPGQGTAEPR